MKDRWNFKYYWVLTSNTNVVNLFILIRTSGTHLVRLGSKHTPFFPLSISSLGHETIIFAVRSAEISQWMQLHSFLSLGKTPIHSRQVSNIRINLYTFPVWVAEMRRSVEMRASVFGRGKIVTFIIKAGFSVIAPDDRVLEATRRRPVNRLP